MSYNEKDTIFVQVASFRDPELQYTLRDLFEKAKNSKNIYVGLCHQFDTRDNNDEHLFKVPLLYPKQVRTIDVYYKKSEGCCWARKKIQKLYKNEKWTLMIDSHMRFVQDWDECLVTNLKEQIEKDKSNRIVFTSYAAGYYREETTDEIVFNENVATPSISFDSGVIRCNGGTIAKVNMPIATFCAHFAFCLAKEFFEDGEYDDMLYFLGEETTIAARLWTKGWTIYFFGKVIIYHYYNVGEKKQKNRPSNFVSERNDISLKRVMHIFNIKKSNENNILKKIEKYSLGKFRTLRDYERYSGVDFRKKKVREFTKKGLFYNWQNTNKIEDVKNIFKNSED